MHILKTLKIGNANLPSVATAHTFSRPCKDQTLMFLYYGLVLVGYEGGRCSVGRAHFPV